MEDLKLEKAYWDFDKLRKYDGERLSFKTIVGQLLEKDKWSKPHAPNWDPTGERE